jgi:hypothetical protein
MKSRYPADDSRNSTANTITKIYHMKTWPTTWEIHTAEEAMPRNPYKVLAGYVSNLATSCPQPNCNRKERKDIASVHEIQMISRIFCRCGHQLSKSSFHITIPVNQSLSTILSSRRQWCIALHCIALYALLYTTVPDCTC